MLDVERRTKILEILNKDGTVEVNKLAELFQVTGATIRRDLRQLATEGMIQRAHGGAVIKKGTLYEPSFENSLESFTEEKEKIAKEAISYINPGDAIFLDSSTTVLHIAKNLKSMSDITVLTNSVPIAYELYKSTKKQLVILGGMLRSETGTVVGPIAEKNIKEFKIDVAFLGISAINTNGEMTDPNIYEATIKRTIIENSNTVIGVADHSKFGNESFTFVASVTKLSTLITDKATPINFIKMLQNNKVEVISV